MSDPTPTDEDRELARACLEILIRDIRFELPRDLSKLTVARAHSIVSRLRDCAGLARVADEKEALLAVCTLEREIAIAIGPGKWLN